MHFIALFAFLLFGCCTAACMHPETFNSIGAAELRLFL
jgi:hypothetical protein